MGKLEELKLRVHALRETFKAQQISGSYAHAFDRGYTLGCIHSVEAIIEDMEKLEEVQSLRKAP